MMRITLGTLFIGLLSYVLAYVWFRRTGKPTAVRRNLRLVKVRSNGSVS